MKTRVIFATVILGLGLASIQATAATTNKTDDSPAATKPASALLVNATQKQFVSYVEQNINKFVKTTDWQNFMSVVSQYNQNPASVLAINPTDRVKFNEAVTQVNNQLAKRKDAVANRWLNQVNHTAQMIDFLWNVDQLNLEVVNNQ